ncbi:tol-pal system-associated acyl-CoA thioesterase [Segnochrobactrum spirostomi]|uniref:Tol-pal system-associated acyl-CoA thioesterase n=1 Tax=Segnochrobactrum spirostomi TaxID=2608987 RepID=A0A6A7Y3E1_9HYPH|nr:tol-pal system-associated acyl-CoA thioesterase [Segnochrobactrum spirostomi]MQT13276.1 tol-pal system-associated acyl-CoA thioesterase [Segnochrobactrum spirostomi]
MNDAWSREWPDLSGLLVGQRHLLPIRVYYEDTDFSGIVYHANYLRFMERGRTDFLRLHGVGHTALGAGEHGEPLAFAVRSMALEFLAPARIDDLLIVETVPALMGGARFTIDQRVLRVGDETEDSVLVTARVTVALIGGDGRPRRIPPGLRAQIASTPEDGAGA